MHGRDLKLLFGQKRYTNSSHFIWLEEVLEVIGFETLLELIKNS